MSQEDSLLDWFEKFMFGTHDDLSGLPPGLAFLVARLESRGVDVNDTLRNGGFANLSHSVNRDLQRVVLYVRDGEEGDPHFETPAVSSFFNSLSHTVGKNLSAATADREEGLFAARLSEDWEILGAILGNEDEGRRFEYSDARFWGELTRRLLHLERPFRMAELNTAPAFLDVMRVYDHTCKMLGRVVDPFSMVMVPREDHVDPVHWRTPEALRRFLKRGDHPLADAVRSVLTNSILEARPEDLPDEWQLRPFLANVRRVHEVVRSVEGPDVPPTLIDVFQRLLTEADRDDLWERGSRRRIDAVREPPAREHLSLYLRVLELERVARPDSAGGSSSDDGSES